MAKSKKKNTPQSNAAVTLAKLRGTDNKGTSYVNQASNVARDWSKTESASSKLATIRGKAKFNADTNARNDALNLLTGTKGTQPAGISAKTKTGIRKSLDGSAAVLATTQKESNSKRLTGNSILDKKYTSLSDTLKKDTDTLKQQDSNINNALVSNNPTNAYKALPTGAFDSIEDDLNKTVTVNGKKVKTDSTGSDESVIKNSLMKNYGLTDSQADFYAKNWDSIKSAKKTSDYYDKRTDKLKHMSNSTYAMLLEYIGSSADGAGEGASSGGGGAWGDNTDIDSKSEALKKQIIKSGISEDDFDAYVQYVQEVENAKKTAADKRETQEAIKNGNVLTKVGYALGDIVASPFSGIAATAEKVKSLTYADKDAPVDTNSSLYALQNRAEAIEEEEENEINNPVGEFLYDTAMSTGKSAMGIAIGGGVTSGLGLTGAAAKAVGSLVTLPSFGATAYSTTYKNAIDNGYGDSNATKQALAAGIAEMAFEEISLDKLQNVAKAGTKALSGQILKTIAKQGAIEGSEEVFTDIANNIADGLINGGFSEYNNNVRTNMASGMSQKQAETKASFTQAMNAGKSFLGGAISGGLMGGGAVASNYIRQNNEAKTLSSSMSDETTQKVYNASLSAPEGTVARRIAENKSVDELTDSDKKEIVNSLREIHADNIANTDKNTQNASDTLTDNASDIQNNDIISDALDSVDNEESQNGRVTLQSATESNVNNSMDSSLNEDENAENKADTQSIKDDSDTGAKAIADALDSVYTDRQKADIKQAVKKANLTVSQDIDEENGTDVKDIAEIRTSSRKGTEIRLKGTDSWQKASDTVLNNAESVKTLNSARALSSDQLKTNYVANYDPQEMGATDYANLYTDVVRGASEGLTLNQIKEASPILTSKISSEKLTSIYLAGKDIESTIVNEATSKQAVKTVENIAKALGKNVVLDNDLGNVNGFYDKDTDTFHLSGKATTSLPVVFAHEFTHYLAQNDSESYAQLYEQGAKWLKDIDPEMYEDISENRKEEYSDQIAQWKENGLSDEEISSRIDEEITANMTEAVMQKMSEMDKNEMDSFSKTIVRENESLAKKILNHIKEFLKKISETIKGYKATSEEAQALYDSKEQLELFQQTLASAYARATQSKKSEGRVIDKRSEQSNESESEDKDTAELRNSMKRIDVGVLRKQYKDMNKNSKAGGILEKGFASLAGKGNIVSNDTIRQIARRLLYSQKSEYNARDFENNMIALFGYITNKAGGHANYDDMIKIAAEVASPVIKESKLESSEDKAIRTYNLALRMYEEYFKAANKTDISERIAKAEENIKKKYEFKEQRRADTEEKRRVRNSIRTQLSRLNRMMEHPSKGSHIPVDMMRAAVDLAKAITDTGNGRRGFKSMNEAQRLEETYKKIEADDNFAYAYDENIAKKISELNEIFKDTGRTLTDLTIDELNTVDGILSAIVTQIKNENEFISAERSETIHEASEKGVQEMQNVKTLKLNAINKFVDKYVNSSLGFDRLLRKIFNYQRNSVGSTLAKLMYDGEIRQLQYMQGVDEIFSDVIDGGTKAQRSANRKKILDFRGQNRLGHYDKSTWVEIPSSRQGEKLLVPKAFRASLAMELMAEDNTRHLIFGGFTVPDMDLYMKGDMENAYSRRRVYRIQEFTDAEVEASKKAVEAFETWDENGQIHPNQNNELWKAHHNAVVERNNLRISQFNSRDEYNEAYDRAQAKVDKAWEEYQRGREKAYKQLENLGKSRAERYLNKLLSDMTPYEKAVIEDAKKYFWDYSGKMLNSVTEKSRGYRVANVEHYFPIRVDADSIVKESEGVKFDATLEGMGFLKERQSSKKPIYLQDIMDVVTNSSRNASKYYGFSLAVRDVNAVLGYGGVENSLKSAIDSKWSASASKEINGFIDDIQVARNDGSRLSFFNKMRSKFAGATLTGNIGVMIKQAASLPTAAAELGWNNTVKTIAPFLRNQVSTKGIEEIESRTPLMHFREQGYSTQELGDLKSMKDVGQSLNWFTGMISGMDVKTVKALEHGAKSYVDNQIKKGNLNLKKGTDEYWNAVTDKFNAVIRNTQPNYSTLERGNFLRDPNALIRTFFMFKTQPLQNFGILYDAFGQYRAAVQSKDKEYIKESKGNFANAITSNLVSAAVFALMTYVVKYLYHTKKDDDEFLENLWENIVSSEVGMFFMGSELYYSIMKFTGKYDYDVFSDSITGMFNDIVDGVSTLNENSKKFFNSKTDEDKDTYFKKLQYNLRKSATSIAKLFGIPVDNVWKPINSMFAWTEDAVNGDFGKFKSEGLPSNSNNTDNIEKQNNRIYDAMIAGDSKEFKRLLNQQILAKYEEKDNERTKAEIKKDILSDVKTLTRDDYTSGKMSEEDAKKYLADSLEYDEDQIEKAITDWRKIKYNLEDLTAQKEDSDVSVDDYVDNLEKIYEEEETIKKQTSTKVKNMYIAGEISESEAKKYLKEYTDKESDEIDNTIKKWNLIKNGDEDKVSAENSDVSVEEWAKALKDAGYSEEYITDNVGKKIKQMYADGKMTEKEVLAAVKKYRGQTGDEAYWTARKYITGEESKYYKVYAGMLDGEVKYDDMVELNQHGVEVKSIKSSLTKYYHDWLKENKNTSKVQSAYLNACQQLGYDREELLEDLQKWMSDNGL